MALSDNSAADARIHESLPKRLWIYQRERFPVFAHGLLIAAFSFSAVSFSYLLSHPGGGGFPAWTAILVAFVSSFFSFLHLRIADEFKDFEEDSQYRAYRPVPRGLIALRELRLVWILTGLLQVILALLLAPRLVFILLLTWLYLALMCREFFVREWLKARPFTYMWTHMLIMPLIDFYATSCDWLPRDGQVPTGLFWFVIVSFFNGFVIEFGRKIRCPQDEEEGVQTYTVLYGRKGAVSGLLSAVFLTGTSASYAAHLIGFLLPAAIIYSFVFLAVLVTGWQFIGRQERKYARRLEMLSGIWTLLLYLSLGAFPLILKLFW